MLQLFKTGCAALVLAGAACGAAFAGPVLIIRSDDSATDNPTNQAVANLSAWQVEAGNTVTVTSTLPLALDGYSQVWDLSFRHPLRNTDSQVLLSYLQQGGRLAMIGENDSLFAARNSDIRQLIADAGGGSVGAHPASAGSVPQTLRAPFADPAATPSLTLAAPAYFDGQGRGSWILAAADDSFGSGVAFDEGDLLYAPAGRLLSMLDVDFMGDLPGQVAGHQLARSLIGYLAADATTTTTGQVPEPSSLALLVLALSASVSPLSARARPRSPVPARGR
jgi:hypothetical protein